MFEFMRSSSSRVVSNVGYRTLRMIVAALAICGSLVCAVEPVHASEARARELAERLLPGHKVDSIRRLPDLPFYEIWIRRNILYTDLDAKVLITGDMLDAKSMSSLRDARVNEIFAFTAKDVPLETAIKTVKGNGENIVYVFSDPHCGFCKQFETELKSVNNVTIYTVLYPVLGPESLSRAKNILCASKPQLTWMQWMESAVAPPAAPESCNVSFDKILAFGRDKNINVTPTTLYADGFRMAGFVPAMTVRDLSNKARVQQTKAVRPQ